MKAGRKIRSVAVRQRGEAEIEDAVEFVERDPHVEAGFCSGETAATGLLHDGKAVEIEPADRIRVDSANGFLLFGFEPGAERGDAVLDEVEARTLHHIVLGVVRRGDDLFGDTEGGADFDTGEFAIFEELKIGAGELGFHDFSCAPKQD